jgi:hypothetical protein
MQIFAIMIYKKFIALDNLHFDACLLKLFIIYDIIKGKTSVF